MKNIPFARLLLLGFLLVSACSDKTNVHLPVDADGTPPTAPYDIQSENIPGGAVITYSVPEDPRLLYVEASYRMSNGKTNQVRASFYGDTLRVLGFSD